MRESDIVRTITIRHKTEGSEQAKASMQGMAAAQDQLAKSATNLGAATETSAKRQASAARSFELMEMRGNSLRKAIEDLNRAHMTAQRAFDQGAISYDRATASLQPYIDRANKAKEAQERLNAAMAASKLATQNRINDMTGVTGLGGKSAQESAAAFGAGLEQLRSKFNPLYAAGQQYRKTVEEINQAHRAGAISERERSAAMEIAKNTTKNQVHAMQEGAKAGRLMAGEMANLSFQLNDVVTGLALGQSPFMIMAQQGGQVYQILANSGGSVSGALKDIGSRLAGIVTVGRLAFGGVVAGATAAAMAVSDFLDKQKEAQRALIGAGARSGATAADINQIGSAGASPTGFSVSEARSVALEFAKTGDIHKRVIGEMIGTTKNFAIITGQSGQEAAQSLAKSFSDMKGIDALNERFLFLGAVARRSIEDLFAQGNTTEAAAQANQRLAERLREVEGTLTNSEKGWRSLTNAVSNYWTALGEVIAQQLRLQPLDTEQQIAQLEKDLERVRKIRADLSERGRSTEGSDIAIARMTKEIERLSAARQQNAQNQDIIKLEDEARKAVGALQPLAGKIRESENALRLMNDAFNQGAVVPGLSEEIRLREKVLTQLQLQEQALQALREKYPGMSDEFAKQVDALQDQNDLLKAQQNGTEATVSAAIAYKNAIAAGANETEAAAIQALTLKNNLLQAGSAARSISIAAGSFLGDDGRFYRPSDEKTHTDGSYLDKPSRMGANGSSRSSFQVGNPFLGAGWTDPGLLPEGQMAFWMKEAADKTQRDLEEARRPIDEWQERMTRQHEEALRVYNEQIEATKANTEALTNVTLNPLYNNRDYGIGFYHAAKGLDMVAQGPTSGDQVPFKAMVNGGERITITPANQISSTANDNRKTTIVNNNNVFMFGGSKASGRRSERQFAQGYSQIVASVS